MSSSLKEVLDCQITGPESLCEELVSGIKISQSFYCKVNNLCAIEIKFGTYGRRNFGKLVFSLRFKDQDFDLIKQVEYLENLKDNSYHSFKFSPIRKSAGREIIFSIESPNCEHGNNIVLWKSIGPFQGIRFVNNQKVKGTICFRTKCLVERNLEKEAPKFVTIPILKDNKIEQHFFTEQKEIHSLSIYLDNYGSLDASVLIELSELGGICLFNARIFSNQISNGHPLIIPFPLTQTQDKIFSLILTSDDSVVGKAIGVRTLKGDEIFDSFKHNDLSVEGTIDFLIQGPVLEESPTYSPFQNVQLMFNNAKPLDLSLKAFSEKKILGLVDIITLNYNRADLLLRCYQSIVKNTESINWKWHVCDNGSTDNSTDLIERFQDSRVTITKRVNNDLGFGEANNLIFKSQATGEYVLFLNNDVLVNKNWLDEMLTILEKDPEIGVVGARLYYPNGSLQHAGIIFRKDGLPVNFSYFFLNPKLKHFPVVDRYFKSVTGACLLMRRADFEQIGGFPQNYDYGYEDIDLCLNVYYNLKKKIVCCANIAGIHEEAATSKKIRRGGRPQDVQFLKKKWDCTPDDYLYLSNFEHNIYMGPQVSKPHFSIATCVTYPEMWMNNIVRPNRQYSQFLEYKPTFNLTKNIPITAAYNRTIDVAKGEYFIFCHQDLKFNSGWFDILNQFIKTIPANWGVIGVAGWSVDGKRRGGLKTPEGLWSKDEGEVQTVDECLLVVHRGLKFDERIIEPHLYGVDICLQAIDKGLKNYALQLPVEHLESGAHPDTWISSYYKALNQIKAKWLPRSPVIRSTTCILRQGYQDVVGVKPPRK